MCEVDERRWSERASGFPGETNPDRFSTFLLSTCDRAIDVWYLQAIVISHLRQWILHTV